MGKVGARILLKGGRHYGGSDLCDMFLDPQINPYTKGGYCKQPILDYNLTSAEILYMRHVQCG